ncbi:MAG: ribonuclease HII [Candidatus Colwellbacteria bacterium]|nr:ribonuclease HII [Candidatus Colwellbacteria bacterium]
MRYTIGIDEVGRGALAGPVVVAAVAVPEGFNSYPRHLPKLKDSKRLSQKQREVWYAYIWENQQLFSASARVYQHKIDRLNISQSANLAAGRALDGVLKQLNDADAIDVVLDGGLYLRRKKHLSLRPKTIVRGDQRRNSIKLASIVAKIKRDKYLSFLDCRYPGYNLGAHKGYGTKMHFQAIRELGILEVHRESFLKSIKMQPKAGSKNIVRGL